MKYSELKFAQPEHIICSSEILLEPYEKMPANEPGFVLIGPSGVGKTTLRNVLCDLDDMYVKYLPLTTRAPRPGEVDEYRSVTSEVMNEVSRLDTAIFGNASYGNQFLTLWPKALPSGKKYIYIYLPEAALKLRDTFPNTKIVQIVPDDVTQLSDRIHSRDTNINQTELAERVNKAETELVRGREIADDVMVNGGSIAEMAQRLRQTLERLQ